MRRMIVLTAMLMLVPVAQAQDLASIDVESMEIRGDLDLDGAFAGISFEAAGEDDEPTGRAPGDAGYAMVLEASKLRLELDWRDVTVATGSVVPISDAATDIQEYGSVVVESLAFDPDTHRVGVFPLGPAAIASSPQQIDVGQAPASIAIRSAVNSDRPDIQQDLGGAVRTAHSAAETVITGDLLISLWSWDFHVNGSHGSDLYRTGVVADRAVDQHIEDAAIYAGQGRMQQAYLYAEDAVLRLERLDQDPAKEPLAMHVRTGEVAGADALRLKGAYGKLDGYSLTGQDLEVTGEAMLIDIGMSSRYIPVLIAGDTATAVVGSDAWVLGSMVPAPPNMIGIVLAASGGFAAAVSAVWYGRRVGRIGPHAHRLLNLADAAVDRGWGRTAAAFAWLHLRRRDTDPAAWKLRGDGLQMAGRPRPEIRARMTADGYLADDDRLYNAMRLVILHAERKQTEEALCWLGLCRRLDPSSVQRLGRMPFAEEMGRDPELRLRLAQALGLESIAVA